MNSVDWDRAKAELAKNLEPQHVKTAKYVNGAFIEGWHAISEANRIFGFDGWSYRAQLTKEAVEQGKDRDGNPQWQAAYTCVVTLTVGDTVREDVGFGSGFAKQIGDAIEGATKEAVTDALKRALRTFGNPFGLALYDKQKAGVGQNVEPPSTEALAAMRDRLQKRFTEAENLQEIETLSVSEKPALKDLHQHAPDWFEMVKAAKDARAAAVMQAPANNHVSGGFDDAA